MTMIESEPMIERGKGKEKEGGGKEILKMSYRGARGSF